MKGLIQQAGAIEIPQPLLAVLVIVFAYVGSYQFASYFAFNPVFLYFPTAVSLATLFFVGVRYWPMVYLGALIGAIFADLSLLAIVLAPLAQALETFLGAYALRRLRIDPIFRKFDDMLTLIFMSFVVSVISPSVSFLVTSVAGTPISFERWGVLYVSSLFNLIIFTPFFLRWTAKRKFFRSPREVIETVIALGYLVVLDYLFFVQNVSTVAKVPLVYFLLIPLFWIALRLRPRFVTLAFALTSAIAITGLFINENTHQLFEIQGLIIVLAIMFYLIVSLEEDRRLNSNLMRSQLSTLENAVSRITSESKAKNDFIAVLAHELRNPLAPVVSGVDFLKLKEDRDPEEMDTLNVMEDRLQVVRHLLEDLLDISRISENKLRLSEEKINLRDVIESAIISTEHHRSERHQSFTTSFPRKRAYVDGDAVRLEQIFSNLLTNASKYTPSGGSIDLSVALEDAVVLIRIKDTGIGIDAASLEAIFTPFHQIESGTRTLKGLGIGLALVRDFVELHGGTVIAESKGLDMGSTFTVALPLSGKEHVPTEAPEAPYALPTKARVLVVDDNDVAASGIGRLLERQGSTVEYAYSATQALNKARTFEPEIVILDLDLPDDSGHKVAERLRAEGYTGRLIALTGLSPHDMRRRHTEDYFEVYLTKPVSNTELRKALYMKR